MLLRPSRGIVRGFLGRVPSTRSSSTSSMKSPLLTMFFVRHGETTGNRDGVLQGHQDYELTTLGEDQAKVTAARLRGVSFWQVHSSDLVRASRTADIILEEHTGVVLRKTPLLREFSLGVLEDLPRGTSRRDAARIKADRAGVLVHEFDEPPSETQADVRRRAQQFLEVLLKDARDSRMMQAATAATEDSGYRDDNTTNTPIALIVSHGGFLHTMLSTVLDLGNNVELPSNCSISIIDVHEGGAAVTANGAAKASGAVTYAPHVLNDSAHMIEAGLSTANRVENFETK